MGCDEGAAQWVQAYANSLVNDVLRQIHVNKHQCDMLFFAATTGRIHFSSWFPINSVICICPHGQRQSIVQPKVRDREPHVRRVIAMWDFYKVRFIPKSNGYLRNNRVVFLYLFIYLYKTKSIIVNKNCYVYRIRLFESGTS